MVIEKRDIRDTRYTADILVRDKNGWFVAAVEVKNATNLNAQVASEFRRNLLVHRFLDERVPYFILISQDEGYVWDQRRTGAADDPPTAAFSMRPVVDHYVPRLARDYRLSGSSLEFVIANWLSDLAAGIAPEMPEVTQPLAATGLLDSLKGAIVSFSDHT